LAISDKGKFIINDDLSDKRDSLSMAARPELREHVNRLKDQDCIPAWLADEKLNLAKESSPKKNWTQAGKLTVWVLLTCLLMML
jgi:hypothetical protein